MIFSSGDLFHQRFSSIDKIYCASISYSIRLCFVTSLSPSSFFEHLGLVLDLLLPPSTCSPSCLWLIFWANYSQPPTSHLRQPLCSCFTLKATTLTRSHCTASCLWPPSNLWSQTSTTSASNLAPQTTSTIVIHTPR
ncbi:uncharacterized protein DS421_4g124310 [Arachis hypogaea]|nr:uncharacterized protein DS421_4g124310 [Arachis hypogaea]